jgi:hypothetical protein
MNERRVAWRRAARGLNLIGFGVFLLLTTQGVLAWSFWADALRLWPVLLVALGLRLVVEKAAPWAVLLSPLLIQGTLAWVAVHPDRLSEPALVFAAGDWKDFNLARSEEAKEWTLDAQLAFARVDLAAGAASGNLVEGRSAGSRGRSVWLAREGTNPRARLRGERHRSGIVWREQTEVWEIRVAEDLPLRVDLSLAFCEGPIDLGSLALTRADLDGAFNRLRVQLPAPERETRVNIEGAFNNLEISVPAGIPVRVEVDGFLNGVDRGGGEAGAGPGYRFDLEGAFNSLQILRSSEAPSGR